MSAARPSRRAPRAALALAAVACVAACASTALPRARQTPGGPATRPGAPAPPRRSRPYQAIPPACSVLGARTLREIAAGTASSETDVSLHGLSEHICVWTGATRPARRVLVVYVDRFSGGGGQSAVAAAHHGIRLGVDLAGGVHPVPGLGDEALLGIQRLAGGRQVDLAVRSQNVVIAVWYGRTPGWLPAQVMTDGAMTAARAVLTALARA